MSLLSAFHAHKRKCFLRASFTVETALLFPMLLLVILSVIYLNTHLHNRTYLLSAACEQAISGEERPLISLFASSDIKRDENESDDLRTVSYSSSTKGIWRIFNWDISEKAEYRILDPTVFIRKTHMLWTSQNSNVN